MARTNNHRYAERGRSDAPTRNSMIPLVGAHAVAALFSDMPIHGVVQRIDHLEVDATIAPKHKAILALAHSEGVYVKTVADSPLTAWVTLRPQQDNQEQELQQFLNNEKSLPPVIAIMDGLTDPHNVGACLRSLYCAGITTVIVPKNDSAPMNATVMKTSSGAMVLVNVFVVNNISRILKLLKDIGFWIYGADIDDPRVVDLFQHQMVFPMALIVGSEGDGMKRMSREKCDFLIRIPQEGAIDSLNVSVATGIIAFEIMRQRKGAGK